MRQKRWFIYLIIGIIMITGICPGYLQYGHNMDVYGDYVCLKVAGRERKADIELEKSSEKIRNRTVHYPYIKHVSKDKSVLKRK